MADERSGLCRDITGLVSRAVVAHHHGNKCGPAVFSFKGDQRRDYLANAVSLVKGRDDGHVAQAARGFAGMAIRLLHVR